MMFVLAVVPGLLMLLGIAGCIYFLAVRQHIPSMVRRLTDMKSQTVFDRRYRMILYSFLTGHNLAANGLRSIPAVRRRLETEIETFYRGFAYEGTGMGFGARAWLYPLRSGVRFERFIYRLDSGHIYQYYVGLGWWLYTVYGFRPAGYRRWMRQLDPYYGLMLFDGVGFKAGLIDYPGDPLLLGRFAIWGKAPMRVCCQGYGRSLWFLGRFEIDSVLARLGVLPDEHQDDIISGIGLAVAYSLFDQPGRVREIARMIPARLRASFQQGLAFGWETRYLQNQPYWAVITKGADDDWRERMEKVVAAVHEARDLAGRHKPEEHYVRWMDETRLLLHQSFEAGGNV